MLKDYRGKPDRTTESNSSLNFTPERSNF